MIAAKEILKKEIVTGDLKLRPKRTDNNRNVTAQSRCLQVKPRPNENPASFCFANTKQSAIIIVMQVGYKEE